MIAPRYDADRFVGRPTLPESIARHLDTLRLTDGFDVDAPIPFTIVPGVIA